MSDGNKWKVAAGVGCLVLVIGVMGLVALSALGICGAVQLGKKVDEARAQLTPEAFVPVAKEHAEAYFEAVKKGDVDAAMSSTKRFSEISEESKPDHIEATTKDYIERGVVGMEWRDDPECKQLYKASNGEMVMEDGDGHRLLGIMCILQYEVEHTDGRSSGGNIVYLGANDITELKVYFYDINHMFLSTPAALNPDIKTSGFYERQIIQGLVDMSMLEGLPSRTGAAPQLPCDVVYVTPRGGRVTQISGDAANRRVKIGRYTDKDKPPQKIREYLFKPNEKGRLHEVEISQGDTTWTLLKVHRSGLGVIDYIENHSSTGLFKVMQPVYGDDSTSVSIRWATFEDDGSVDTIGNTVLKFDADGDVVLSGDTSLADWRRAFGSIGTPLPFINRDPDEKRGLEIALDLPEADSNRVIAHTRLVTPKGLMRQNLNFGASAGDVTTRTYSNVGTPPKKRLVLEDIAGKRKESSTYDADARLTEMKVEMGKWSAIRKYTYDERDRLTGFTVDDEDTVKGSQEPLDARFYYEECADGAPK